MFPTGSARSHSCLHILQTVNHFTLIEEGFPSFGPMDVAVSHAILDAVSRGEMGGVFRLHRPGPVVAFGRSDRVEPGYPQAVRAAEDRGFSAVERLAGGRAAVFHEGTLAFSWAVPDPDPRAQTMQRFETIAGVMAEAFAGLGLDARIGELPGEYCPGAWSVNLGGEVKVMGVGQRLVRNAAHVGGVVVVNQGDRIKDVLVPVYEALGLAWDPSTAGSLADHRRGLDGDTVERAITRTLADRLPITPGKLPSVITERALALANDHLPEVA